jgi:hypothetical protein
MTQQPSWKCIGHVGDCDPIAHGGGFIYIDTTGVYGPEMTWFEPAPDDDWHKTEGATPLQVYRLMLEPPRFKTFKKYIGADGREYVNYQRALMNDPAQRDVSWYWAKEWWVKSLPDVASSCGQSQLRYLRDVVSKDPMRRAHVYVDMIGYHGPDNFDSYPVTMTEDEAYAQYASEMKEAR